MAVNMRLLPHFILLFACIYGLLSGIFTIRTGEFRMPFTRENYIQGRKALLAGIVMIVIGIASGVMLSNMYSIFD